MKWRILVLGELGWVNFIAGYCVDETIARAQADIFRSLYPHSPFTIVQERA